MTTPGRRHEWAALAALMIGFAALFVRYYPPISGVEDEAGFVNQALVWSRGAITAEGAGWPQLIEFEPVNGRHVATRHPGRSLVALPFLMLGGSRALFASGLLLHLATTAIAAALLVRLGRSPLWAVLVLCHPTLALYSRTIMADAASGTGLLLAALFVASNGSAAGIGAGLAVGLAALMRYHAGMALPLVAASFLSPADRPHRRRQAALCLAAGIGAGGVIVIYNLAVYGTPLEPFTGKRGFFSWRFFLPQAQFYGTALMVIWPAMLLAPLLDRSRLRWLIRGLCTLFLGSLLFYYFHDTRPGWLETVILGQRLLQVILPLWIVSFAGVVDDWLAAPLRQALGGKRALTLAIFLSLGLLAGDALIFARHQRYLNALRVVRDEVSAHVPEGSLVLQGGSLYKLIGTPLDVPWYRLRALEFEGHPAEEPETLFRSLDREPDPWFVAVLLPTPGASVSEYTREVVARFGMEPVPVRSPQLALYVHRSHP